MILYTLLFNKVYLNEAHFLHNYKIIDVVWWNFFSHRKNAISVELHISPQYFNIVWQYDESTLWVVLSERNI